MEPAIDDLPLYEDPLPALTPKQMRALDEQVVDDVGLPLLAMMENAGARLAETVRRTYPGAERVAVLTGKGNNGGGGLAGARHLMNAGLDVSVHLAADRDEFAPTPARQAQILAPEVPRRPPGDPLPETVDALVDAMLGYAQQGAPRGPVAERVRQAEDALAPIVALDVPTGLDPETGAWAAPALVPEVTVTLALPKLGLARADPQPWVPLLADIGIPRRLYEDRGVQASPFAQGPLVGWRSEVLGPIETG